MVLLLGATTLVEQPTPAVAIRERPRQHTAERLVEIARKEEMSLSFEVIWE